MKNSLNTVVEARHWIIEFMKHVFPRFLRPTFLKLEVDDEEYLFGDFERDDVEVAFIVKSLRRVVGEDVRRREDVEFDVVVVLEVVVVGSG